MLLKNRETDKQRDIRYACLFKELDIEGNGRVTLDNLVRAFEKNDNPLKGNDEAIKMLFTAMDVNRDSVVDLSDFKRYASNAESQIWNGFQRIDLDHDGKIGINEINRYLADLDNQNICNNELSNKLSNEKNNKFSRFFKWAFPKKKNNAALQSQSVHKDGSDKDFSKPTNSDLYVTYDQWRDFLLLIPRKQGSRLHTAYSYFYLFNEDVNLSSEGDVTLINDFIRGFGFFIAGGISGVISRTCTAPFDRLKVFLIARTDLSSTLLNSKTDLLAKNPNADITKISSPLAKAVKSLYRQGGIKAFYVGNGLNVVKVFPESSIKFGSFEITKKIMTKLEGCKDTRDLSKFSTYIAGGLAGMAAQFSVYPIDTLKFRVQCAPLDTKLKGNRLLFQTAKDMFREGGLKLFYRGVTVGILGIFPYAALDLGTFSALKKRYITKQAKALNLPQDQVTLSNLVVLPMGAFSGTVGASVVYPINLLRTRLQAQGTYAHPYVYNGFKDVLLKTIEREGYQGLFKGLIPTLAKVCPAVSISYLCYENLKKFMNLE
ncbi:Sal1p [Saccharomyces cerevisiae x Saccharomyces kudriavzevii VIN7]|uniref:Sal1p n=1 Tax=Saccharomyces cerevisiae x Saccharomyces kudriavzevii (strain VIN7) TaxID=1095631 RepID=H0H096_SACCK|nr:Sal1p [Saccharomyces cerevisiae x Saccharomyces kudriavzevii VIN7]